MDELSLTLVKGEQWVDFRRAVMAFQEPRVRFGF
jgi:hypothetical protein